MHTSIEEVDSLIQRAKGGGLDAWEILVARYQKELHEHIRRHHPRSLTAYFTTEDILQEALLQAWLDIGSLRNTEPAAFGAWLKAIADRRVSDAIKGQQRLKRGGGMHRAGSRDSEDGCWNDLLDALPAEAKTASSILSRKETAQALRAAVGVLPQDQQSAVRLHYLEGVSIDQTALTMKRTSAAVRGLLHRGKERLAGDLESASHWFGRRPRVTRLLAEIESGDRKSADELLPVVYHELRKLAAQKLRHEQPGQTLQATALVHEAYVRLIGSGHAQQWDSRGHFFAAAAEAMRRILIDRARKKGRQRHGGGLAQHASHEVEIASPEPSVDLLNLNDALEQFEKLDPTKAELVKLRYFAGLTIPEAAEALGISTTTADRYWAYARAWLHAEMETGRE
jgi:RNA polymerase sigma factor (TIGR02999 family)